MGRNLVLGFRKNLAKKMKQFAISNLRSMVKESCVNDQVTYDFNERRKMKKKQSLKICVNHHRHRFTQDLVFELIENREQMQQFSTSSSSSSSSPICDRSGSNTPIKSMEDVNEMPELELDSETELEQQEQMMKKKKKFMLRLGLGLSFFVIAAVVVAVASLIWMHLQDDDDTMLPLLVPT